MFLIPKSGLQRQLLFYIIFIGVVFLTMAVEMQLFLRSKEILGSLQALLPSDKALDLVQHILIKMRLMLGILLLAIGLVMLLFTKRILFPLERIIARTRAMSAGDFSAALPEQNNDELGELARHINDLNVNQQELILLTSSMVEQVRESLDKQQVDQALQTLDELDEALAEFGRSFYQC